MTKTLLALSLGVALVAHAAVAHAQALPVPGVEAARDVPGAKEMPNPAVVHKVLFDMATAGPKPTEVHPMLQAVARYVNTLAKTGVPAANRKVAVVFHQDSTDYILTNEAYKARHGGQDNPNLAMMQALKKAGVDLPRLRPGHAGPQDRRQGDHAGSAARLVGAHDHHRPAAAGLRPDQALTGRPHEPPGHHHRRRPGRNGGRRLPAARGHRRRGDPRRSRPGRLVVAPALRAAAPAHAAQALGAAPPAHAARLPALSRPRAGDRLLRSLRAPLLAGAAVWRAGEVGAARGRDLGSEHVQGRYQAPVLVVAAGYNREPVIPDVAGHDRLRRAHQAQLGLCERPAVRRPGRAGGGLRQLRRRDRHRPARARCAARDCGARRRQHHPARGARRAGHGAGPGAAAVLARDGGRAQRAAAARADWRPRSAGAAQAALRSRHADSQARPHPADRRRDRGADQAARHHGAARPPGVSARAPSCSTTAAERGSMP